ncbi:leucyl aminopeptidase [Aquirhabdus parva]|uniref:Probable cytosol aminopeptidase n=1 Tax=Aquirhabdus parva TaxID=2283318 RepID=A0A345P2T3_9GAMM|nr:leucyl aminopeptidase [Aquirhabdus parva]AXI01592.1 leucyl aminopeptidase [Aquirhabdus parva]
MPSATHTQDSPLLSSALSLLTTAQVTASSEDVLVILLDSDALSGLPTTLSASAQQAIQASASRAGFSAKLGETLPLYQAEQDGFEQILIVGAGTINELNAGQAQKLAASIIKALAERTPHAVIAIDSLPDAAIEPFALALANKAYQFDVYKSKKSTNKLKSITLQSAQADALQARINLVNAVHIGQSFTRNLANQPGNICFPEYLADQAIALAAEFPDVLKTSVLDEAQMAELGMHSFLAVSKGSERPGRLVTLEYNGKKDDSKPVVLVGKGVTFDTGGISLKPGPGMEDMKFDMSGAASVLGIIRAVCVAKLPINVVGALACAENMPSGRATRPGDIVTSMSGQTIEILNTDAEGRLVLCDTLTYIERFNPEIVIDMATLTGACVVALGEIVSGLFSADEELVAEILQAGLEVHDRAWRLPLLEDYQELLDSPVADMANIGGRTAGATTAACFLWRYTKQYRWAHLDIAGTANTSGANKGSTGRPVPLLMQFLRKRAGV